MSEFSAASTARRDRVTECHARAAADRLQARDMDTDNGRRKLEHSAQTWDERAELLGRLDASFNKREQLDAAASRFRQDSARDAPKGPLVPAVEEEPQACCALT